MKVPGLSLQLLILRTQAWGTLGSGVRHVPPFGAAPLTLERGSGQEPTQTLAQTSCCDYVEPSHEYRQKLGSRSCSPFPPGTTPPWKDPGTPQSGPVPVAWIPRDQGAMHLPHCFPVGVCRFVDRGTPGSRWGQLGGSRDFKLPGHAGYRPWQLLAGLS